MVKYEIKKVFAKNSSKIAILLLLAVCLVTGWFAMSTAYVNEAGESEKGPAAVRKLRTEKEAWSGVLNMELIAKVIEENRRISLTPEATSKDYHQNNIAYSWKQGFSDVRDLLNSSYADGFQEYNYYKADSLLPEQAEDFYPNRTRLLQEWLKEDAAERFSAEEKAYLLQQYEKMPVPLAYEYMEGWTQLFEYSSTIIMIVVLVLGYLVAGIFSDEFQWRTDSVFFTSYHGRNKAISAKIKAGFVIATVVYWVVLLLFSLAVLLYYGTSGANSLIQTDWGKWKSIYYITNQQAYLLITIGGYLGCVFITSLTMLVSAKTKSTVVAVLVPFMLTFIPSFISGLDYVWVNKIIGLLPDQLLQISMALRLFNLYSVGGNVVGALPILFIMYAVMFTVLQPVIYRVYRLQQ